MSVAELVALSLLCCLAEDYLLPRILRRDAPALPEKTLLNVAVGSLCVAAVTFLLTVLTWFFVTFLLEPWNLAYLRPLVYALLLAGAAVAKKWGLARFTPKLNGRLVGFLPRVGLSCGIFAIAPLLDAGSYGGARTALYALAIGGIYVGTAILAYSVQKRLDWSAPPKKLAGLPLALIAGLLLVLALV
ncbi:MAG: hypothetical protein RSB55_04320 [Oscillospiraceae bacterium]